MGDDSVGEIGAKTGERVDGKVNRTRPVSESEAGGGSRFMQAKNSVNNELTEIAGGAGSGGGGLVRRSWVDGSKEKIWKPSLRIRLRW